MTNDELESILIHSRALIDAATEIDWIRAQRGEAAEQALLRWRGPLAEAFAARVSEENEALSRRAAGLRDDADRWAQAWADIVNQINTERREAAVDYIRSQRSFSEGLLDVFVGDDSDSQVPAYRPVSAPSANSRFQPTGGLQIFC